MLLLWSSRDNDVVFVGTSKGPAPGRPGGSNSSRSRRRQRNTGAIFISVLYVDGMEEDMNNFGLFLEDVRNNHK